MRVEMSWGEGPADQTLNEESQLEDGIEAMTSEADDEVNAGAEPEEDEMSVASSEQGITPLLLCVGAEWYKASRIRASDSVQHCVATCGSARMCGMYLAGQAAVRKEIFDQLCRYAPSHIKRALNDISQCGGWSNSDIAADLKGAACAAKVWRGCRSCCGV